MKAIFANEFGGIRIEREGLPDLYVTSGEIYERAISGEFGPIEPYTPEPEPDPLESARQSASLTPMQFELAILENDLIDEVLAFIEHPETPRAIKIMYSRASIFDRMNPELNQMAELLGYTDELMDIVFGIEVEQ